MTETERMDRSRRPNAAWHVRLDCGHVIDIPLGLDTPELMGSVVEHRGRCDPHEVPELAATAWWAAPVDRAIVAPFSA